MRSWFRELSECYESNGYASLVLPLGGIKADGNTAVETKAAEEVFGDRAAAKVLLLESKSYQGDVKLLKRNRFLRRW